MYADITFTNINIFPFFPQQKSRDIIYQNKDNLSVYLAPLGLYENLSLIKRYSRERTYQ